MLPLFFTVGHRFPLHCCELSFGLRTSIIPWTSMDFHGSKHTLWGVSTVARTATSLVLEWLNAPSCWFFLPLIKFVGFNLRQRRWNVNTGSNFGYSTVTLRIFSLSNLSNFLLSDVLKAFEEETAILRLMLLRLQTVHTLAAKTLRSLESFACIAACGFSISKRTIVKDMSLISDSGVLEGLSESYQADVLRSSSDTEALRHVVQCRSSIRWVGCLIRDFVFVRCWKGVSIGLDPTRWSSAKASVRGRKSASRSTGGTWPCNAVTICDPVDLKFVPHFLCYWGVFTECRFWLARCKSCKAQNCTSATVCSTVYPCIFGGFCCARCDLLEWWGMVFRPFCFQPLLCQSMKPNLTRRRNYDIHFIWFCRSQCWTPPIQDFQCGIYCLSDLWKVFVSGAPCFRSAPSESWAFPRHRRSASTSQTFWWTNKSHWRGSSSLSFFARLPLVWAIQPQCYLKIRLCHVLPKESVLFSDDIFVFFVFWSQDFCLRGLFGHPDEFRDGRCSDVCNVWPEWQDLESATNLFPIGKSSRWEMSRASHAEHKLQ